MWTGKLDPQGRLIKTGRARIDGTDPLAAAYRGETDTVLSAIRGGADVNMTDPQTGLAMLHIATGTNNIVLAKALIEEHGAGFFADRLGRWPSVIAAECQVDDDLSDYIVEAEARFLEQSGST